MIIVKKVFQKLQHAMEKVEAYLETTRLTRITNHSDDAKSVEADRTKIRALMLIFPLFMRSHDSRVIFFACHSSGPFISICGI